MENHDLRRRRDSLAGFLGHKLHRLCPSRSVCSHSLLHSDRWLSQISNEEASSLELQDQQPFAVPNAAVLCLQAYVDVQPSLARIHSSEVPESKAKFRQRSGLTVTHPELVGMSAFPTILQPTRT